MSLSSTIKDCALSAVLGGVIGAYALSAGFLWLVGAKDDRRLPPLEAAAALDWAVLPYTAYSYEKWNEKKNIGIMLDAAKGGTGVAFFAGMVVPLFRRKRPTDYGDARFATPAEAREAGLFAKCGYGIPLGRLGSRILRLAGELGVGIEAPPGQGKDTGLIIPLLLEWRESAIVNDIKGETWKKTAGWRRSKLGQLVYLFAPLQRNTNRSNVYGYVPDYEDDPARCFDAIQNIATQLFPHVGGPNSFWQDNARNYHIGLTLSLFETPGTLRTMGEVLRQGMAQDATSFRAHWEAVIAARDKAGKPFSQRMKQIMFELITQDPKTIGGIRAQWSAKLQLWQNPMIDAATSPGRCGNVGDFDLRELRKQPMTVYLKIPPKDIAKLEPLLNLFWEQAFGLQCDDLPEEAPRELKYHAALVLNELAACGYLPSLATYAGFMRQFWIRLIVSTQNMTQLQTIYGDKVAKTLMSMLAVRIKFPPQSREEAVEISKDLFDYTAEVKTTSISGGKKTVTTKLEARPLMRPEEVMRLGAAKQLVFYHEPGRNVPYNQESLRPILARRIYSFADSVYRYLFYPAPSVPAVELIIDRPLSPSPAVAPYDATVSDAKTLDKAPASRFIVSDAQAQLPFDVPTTQPAANALVALFTGADGNLGVAHG